MLTDEQLADILRYDFSKGTEKFRDELLARCLAILDEEEKGEATSSESDLALVYGGEGCELDDEDIDMVAGGTGTIADDSKNDTIIR